jgi:hypothetical protein
LELWREGSFLAAVQAKDSLQTLHRFMLKYKWARCRDCQSSSVFADICDKLNGHFVRWSFFPLT